jgi:hypothetical protein
MFELVANLSPTFVCSIVLSVIFVALAGVVLVRGGAR